MSDGTKTAATKIPGNASAPVATDGVKAKPQPQPQKVPETGGPSGPEPTRYGDWERKGRCIDF